MTTTLSTKGQVVLNSTVRRSLGLMPGTVFSVRCDKKKRSVVLEPLRDGRPKGRIIKNKAGFSVLRAPAGVAKLTPARVRDMLTDFP